MQNRLRVSLVIPVYNEESHLKACLEAIAAQTVKPFEVIVVDNNSNDQTVEIARRFPFVTILHEPRQGAVFARDAGFNAARGEIIGRIDGDTRISPTWIADVQAVFADGTVAAATGRMHYYEMSLPRLTDAVDLLARRYMRTMLGREVALQGSNMALRRSVWLAVRGQLCAKRAMHEDFDLAIHVTARGGLVVFTEAFAAYIGYRLAETSYKEFVDYAMTSPRTYLSHGRTSGRQMYPVVALVVACYWPLKLLRHGYDEDTGRFSWRLALTATSGRRVNPATYGDLQ